MQTKTKTSISIAISGLAGPERGNERAPVGTVYIAITLPHGTKCYQFKFEGNRQQIIIQTCVEALKILLGELKILVIQCVRNGIKKW
ncbi:MAG: CinA family protein [Rickettsiaceae bacterium]|nr:CinA family protein [Rickettsiaceae bacterium]MCP5375069.1 CinA family protein [Rickettsiaceae bacterium]